MVLVFYILIGVIVGKVEEYLKSNPSKIITIARTKHPKTQYEGIKIMDIARWLDNSQK